MCLRSSRTGLKYISSPKGSQKLLKGSRRTQGEKRATMVVNSFVKVRRAHFSEENKGVRRQGSARGRGNNEEGGRPPSLLYPSGVCLGLRRQGKGHHEAPRLIMMRFVLHHDGVRALVFLKKPLLRRFEGQV